MKKRDSWKRFRPKAMARREPEAGTGLRPVQVLRSLIAPEGLARIIESSYGLPAARCQLIQSTVRDTYEVRSDLGRFIFCVYAHDARPLPEIEAELEFIEHLGTAGLPVGPAVPTGDGRRWLRLAYPEGERFGVLFTYLEGRPLREMRTAPTASAYGRVIARLHLAADAMAQRIARPVIDWSAMVAEPVAAFAAVADHRSGDVELLRAAAGRLRARLEALPAKSPGAGMIHGDVIPSNALVRPDGSVALLDFDFCGYGWRAYDVATFLAEMAYWEVGDEVGAAFVAGYESVRPPAPWERANIPLLVTARHIFALGVPARRVNEWGNRYFSATIVDRLMGLVRQGLDELD